MRHGGLIIGMSSVWVAMSPLTAFAMPIPLFVGPIQSIGGDQNFCPSGALQQAVIQGLSSNRAYNVEMLPLVASQAGVQVTGKANCSLALRQRQRGFLFVQQRSTITTATVELHLQLINTSTGATIATIAEQGQAQVETQTTPDQFLPMKTQSEKLFEQAIAQALAAILPKVNTAIE